MSSSPSSGGGAGAASRGRASVAWIAVQAFGLAGWLLHATFRDADQAWRALLVNFVFFTPLAAAMVVWPAVVMLSRGEWLGPVKRDALAGIALAPASLLAFAALWAGRAHWAAWLSWRDLPNHAWLSGPFLFGRDAAALALWWLVAWRFAREARTGAPRTLAGWTAFLYAVVFSLIGFDMVMALEPRWASSLFGAYFFVSGLYAAAAALAFLAAQRPVADPDRLHDLGKLVVAFSIGTTYMMFSQLLPIWYENLPNEALFVLPRLSFRPWSVVSAALIALVYLGPLVLLLSARAKRTPWYLGTVALLVLAGLWIERWWLVAPTLGQGPHLNAADVSMAAAFVGALGWGVSRARRQPSGGDRGEGRHA